MTTTASTVLDTYRALHPRSLALYERARGVIPGGVTHDGRHLKPFPIYVDRAEGALKWDVDGHEYVDYWMGHGALFLGHCHPAVVRAIQAQAARGTHLGACHELEVRWAELITTLIPSAEMVRFTMSGTEATHLALRIARAYTGRSKVVKFHGHFHGWHDGVVAAVNPPFEVPMSAGVPSGILDQLLLCPPNDMKAVQTLLERRDVAAVILEPAGGQSGTTPALPGYLQELRSAGQQAGRRAARGARRGDEARGRARRLLRRGVDLPRVLRGPARLGRLRPAATRRPLPPPALRIAQQRGGLVAPPRLGLRRAHRGPHRAHRDGLREGLRGDGGRRQLQRDVTPLHFSTLSPLGRGQGEGSLMAPED